MLLKSCAYSLQLKEDIEVYNYIIEISIVVLYSTTLNLIFIRLFRAISLSKSFEWQNISKSK